MAAKRILVYGEDRLVISTRAMILQRAGYDVVQTTNPADLLSILQGIVFDIALIGDSIRHQKYVRLVQKLRERLPGLLILMVQDEMDERDAWSSDFVSSTPELLLKAIGNLLDGGKKPVASSETGKPSAGRSRKDELKSLPGAAG
jgi:hypothetical protein